MRRMFSTCAGTQLGSPTSLQVRGVVHQQGKPQASQSRSSLSTCLESRGDFGSPKQITEDKSERTHIPRMTQCLFKMVHTGRTTKTTNRDSLGEERGLFHEARSSWLEEEHCDCTRPGQHEPGLCHLCIFTRTELLIFPHVVLASPVAGMCEQPLSFSPLEVGCGHARPVLSRVRR